jgi:hypothetical protein
LFINSPNLDSRFIFIVLPKPLDLAACHVAVSS